MPSADTGAGTGMVAGTGAAAAKATPPGAPSITALAPGDAEVKVSWSAPSSDGGAAISGYTVTVSPGGKVVKVGGKVTSTSVTKLVNGTGYVFAVTASNSAGAGPASAAVGPVTPAGVPGPPADVRAAAANASVTLSWSPPATNAGDLTGYTVTVSPGGRKVAVNGFTTSVTVTKLTNGTSYTFAVAAADAAGTGKAAVSAAVKPGPVPGPPTDVMATAGSAAATVSWVAPASAGGAAVSGYTVTAVPGNAQVHAGGTARTATVTGLTNGISYRFYVVAANKYGDSAPSASSAPATPAAPAPPDAPFITNVTAQDSAVQVSWAPPDTGVAGLTGYVITVSAGGAQVSTVTEAASASSALVTGLTNGTLYTFTVAAVNAAGTGPASAPSVPVSPRPATPPLAPASPVAVALDGEVEVIWVAPPDGGSPVTGYTVSVSPATVGPVTTAAGTTVVTVTGLKNGTAYKVSITAANQAGTSPAAVAGPVTPEAKIVPAAPGGLIASATAAGAVALQWSPPADPGTSVVTSYVVTAKAGTTVAKTVTVAASACTGTPLTCKSGMTGLVKSTAYTFTAVAKSAAGSSAASAAAGPVTPDVTVSSAPVLLPAAAAATLRYVESDGTLVFEQPPSSVTGLTAGKIVYVPATAVAPQGFLGKVTGVSRQGGLVAVTTSAVTLNNVYSAFQASMRLPFSAGAAQLAAAAPGVSLSRPMLDGKAVTGAVRPADSTVSIQVSGGSLTLDVDMDLEQGDTEDGSGTTVTTGPVLNLEASVTLTPILDVSFQHGSLDFTIGGSVSANADALIGAHLQASPKVFLGEIDGPEVDVPVGEIPVPSQVVFTAYAVASLDGSIGIEFYASYQHTAAADCTIHIDSSGTDGCSGVNQSAGQNGGLQAGVTPYAAMTGSVGVQLGVSLQIAFLAGPEITVTPQLAVDVNTTANPWWTLDLEGDLGVAVTAGQAWGEGTTLYQDADVVTIGPIQLASAGGPFDSLEITPGQATLATNGTQTFTATLITAGISSSPKVTWSVTGPGSIDAAGPGSISSTGDYTAPNQDGVAIVQATYQPPSGSAETARASVIIGAALQTDNPGTLGSETQGLVDAAEADWVNLGLVTLPSEYAVTAQAAQAGAPNPYEVVYAPASATHAYLPGLTPGLPYTLTVYALGAGGGVIGSAPGVVPLFPLPGELAGTGTHGDVAISADGKPDDTGTAGSGVAALGGAATVSGNGEYVFFFTEARSNLAPASIYNPASTTTYLLRRNLLTGQTNVASIGPDGNPVPAFPSNESFAGPTGNVDVGGGSVPNEDGSAVAFYPDTSTGSTQPLVHDFTSNTTWQVGTASLYPAFIGGLSSDGNVVAFDGFNPNAFESPTHVYRQVEGESPQQVDACPETGYPTCNDGASEVSMSANGNLIAYEAQGPLGVAGEAYVYDASTGQDSSALVISYCFDVPFQNWIPCYTEENPVISADGSTLALDVIDGPAQLPTQDVYLALDRLGGFPLQNVLASDTQSSDSEAVPLALSQDGNAMVYANSTAGPAVSIEAYTNGTLAAAPMLSTTSEASADITAGGSTVVYTVLSLVPTYTTNSLGRYNYPDVYEWQPSG
jgi:hypothetical protein